NQEKGKSRADKLFELPIEDFNISNKNEEIYHFFVDEDEEKKIVSDNDDSDSKRARLKELLCHTLDEHSRLGLGSSQSRPRNYDDSRFFYVVSRPKDIPRWAYVTSESENDKVSETSTKRRRVTDYDRSIMYSRNSELETGESSTI
ncbi:5795_t:CDS:2, partial [Gigaspora rosea]